MAESTRQMSSLVSGQYLVAGGRDTRPVFNPATGEVLGELALARKEDVAAAADAALRGFAQWSIFTPLARAQILKATADAMRANLERLAALITQEQGKTIREARAEAAGAAELLEWLAEEGKRVYGRLVSSRAKDVEQSVRLEPIGPVAAFSPWNYPLALAARKIGHALAAGCSVVIKPAEEAPSAVLYMVELLIKAGVPPQAVQVLFGDPAMLSESLITSPVIQKISFTGSVPVGRHLAQLSGRELKRVTFELGGHAPVIVMNDCDVEQAVALSVASKFRNAGQICISPTRFFVHDGIYEKFVAEFVRRSKALRVGDGADEGTDMGPLAHDRRVSAMHDLTHDAVSAGATLLAGELESVATKGYFWQPTVLGDVPSTAKIMHEEPFGPLAPFSRFDDLTKVIDASNSLEYGLAGYAFTGSLRSARLIRDGMRVGALGINTYAVNVPEMPFAGVKSSGLGVAQGAEGIREHMNIKSVFTADA